MLLHSESSFKPKGFRYGEMGEELEDCLEEAFAVHYFFWQLEIYSKSVVKHKHETIHYLIIGAGLFGSVMAEQLVRQGKDVL